MRRSRKNVILSIPTGKETGAQWTTQKSHCERWGTLLYDPRYQRAPDSPMKSQFYQTMGPGPTILIETEPATTGGRP